jgi:hypothetical protein
MYYDGILLTILSKIDKREGKKKDRPMLEKSPAAASPVLLVVI